MNGRYGARLKLNGGFGAIVRTAVDGREPRYANDWSGGAKIQRPVSGGEFGEPNFRSVPRADGGENRERSFARNARNGEAAVRYASVIFWHRRRQRSGSDHCWPRQPPSSNGCSQRKAGIRGYLCRRLSVRHRPVAGAIQVEAEYRPCVAYYEKLPVSQPGGYSRCRHNGGDWPALRG